VIWLLAFVWTVLELFNPEHVSTTLAVVGFRAYWLWWLAPLLVAHVLRDEKGTARCAIYVLLGVSDGRRDCWPAVQFVSPAGRRFLFVP
jgi:hypothetical protein